MALFAKGLLPASFRGVPFAVVATDEQFGRRVALHVYPGRDIPWAEDMGRAPRTFRLRGFIVSDDPVYVGGPIQVQRALLTAAAEKAGSGVLTHPTLGVLQVACRGFSLGQDLGAGRASEVSFEFVESGKRSFPSLLTSGSGLLSTATLCDIALALDVARAIKLATSAGGRPDQLAASGAAWTRAVRQAGGDATALRNLAARLPGNNGRYAAGATGSATATYAADATLADLVADASAQREAIATAADALTTTIVAMVGADVAASATALVAALLAACADPADAVRLLLGLIGFEPSGVDVASAIGTTLSRAIRRAAAVALARACAAYQPSSYDDAFALMAKAAAVIGEVATEAADAGDDESFATLRAVRAEVVKDLRARGALLARVRTVAFALPQPALTLAQRLYRDPRRADELVGEANPPHPLFMPTSFQALAA